MEVLRSEDRQPQSPPPTPGLQGSTLPGWTWQRRGPVTPGPPNCAPGGTVSVGSLSGSQCCPNPSPRLVCSLPGPGRSPGSLAAPLPLPGGQEHRGRSAEGPHPSLPSSHPPSLGPGSTKGIADDPRSCRAGQRKGASRLGAGPQSFPKTGQRSELGSQGRNLRKGPLLTWSAGQSHLPQLETR